MCETHRYSFPSHLDGKTVEKGVTCLISNNAHIYKQKIWTLPPPCSCLKKKSIAHLYRLRCVLSLLPSFLITAASLEEATQNKRGRVRPRVAAIVRQRMKVGQGRRLSTTTAHGWRQWWWMVAGMVGERAITVLFGLWFSGRGRRCGDSLIMGL